MLCYLPQNHRFHLFSYFVILDCFSRTHGSLMFKEFFGYFVLSGILKPIVYNNVLRTYEVSIEKIWVSEA